MSDFPKWPLVYVEWDDSSGGAYWKTLEEMNNEPASCRSVGWLAKQDKRAITLYSDLATQSENKHAHGHSEQTIPAGCVKRIVKIRQPKSFRRGK